MKLQPWNIWPCYLLGVTPTSCPALPQAILISSFISSVGAPTMTISPLCMLPSTTFVAILLSGSWSSRFLWWRCPALSLLCGGEKSTKCIHFLTFVPGGGWDGVRCRSTGSLMPNSASSKGSDYSGGFYTHNTSAPVFRKTFYLATNLWWYIYISQDRNFYFLCILRYTRYSSRGSQDILVWVQGQLSQPKILLLRTHRREPG